MLSATEDRALSKFHFFSTDDELFYEPFYADFGPLNLGATYRFCQCDPPLFFYVFVRVVFRIRLRARRILNTKLNDPELSKKCIVYYSSLDPQKRSNSVTVIGVYAVYYLRFTPDEACKLVSSMYDPLCSTRPEHTTSHVHAHRSAACAQRTLRIRRHLRAYTRAGALVRARLQWGHTRPSGWLHIEGGRAGCRRCRYPPLLPFRDASYGGCTYGLTAADVIRGMYAALVASRWLWLFLSRVLRAPGA